MNSRCPPRRGLSWKRARDFPPTSPRSVTDFEIEFGLLSDSRSFF
jgi:hypothetical protein